LSVRDIKSYELLKSWGINADLVCDPIFSTKIEEPQKNPVVAVQLRDYKTVTKDFIDRLARKIIQEFPNKSIEIFSFQDSIDLERCNQLANAIKMLSPDSNVAVFNELSDEDVIEKISKAEYLIAMRFHAIIVGLLSSVKTLGINYDIKVEKLATEFNIPILHLQKDFNDEFKQLKEQDLTTIQAQISIKNFNWEGFEKAINN
jgi:polysaccharide pyruvyl transferase WcaK-like protein